MKNLLYIILLAFTMTMLSGCIGYEDVEIVKIKDWKYQELDIRNGTLRLSIVATVNNPNHYNIKITNAKMDLRLKERVLGNITQLEQIKLEKRKEKDYTIQVSIELKGLVSNMMGLYRIFMNDTKDLNLSGTVHVKALLASKTIKVDNLSF